MVKGMFKCNTVNAYSHNIDTLLGLLSHITIACIYMFKGKDKRKFILIVVVLQF